MIVDRLHDPQNTFVNIWFEGVQPGLPFLKPSPVFGLTQFGKQAVITAIRNRLFLRDHDAGLIVAAQTDPTGRVIHTITVRLGRQYHDEADQQYEAY